MRYIQTKRITSLLWPSQKEGLKKTKIEYLKMEGVKIPMTELARQLLENGIPHIMKDPTFIYEYEMNNTYTSEYVGFTFYPYSKQVEELELIATKIKNDYGKSIPRSELIRQALRHGFKNKGLLIEPVKD